MLSITTWLRENGLALYGAITGSVALVIAFLGHRHNVSKDTIKLLVTFAEHRHRDSNIQDLLASREKSGSEKLNLVEVYVVTVRNLGHIDAPLEDVGIITASADRKCALIRSPHFGNCILERASAIELGVLAPKASSEFSVYLKQDEPVFTAKCAYVVDQTGKMWTSRV
jgi:hypothetical protein